jgi:hypothetical protein
VEADPVPEKPRRGRPPGSRNRLPTAFTGTPILTPPANEPGADYKHADIETIISRQLSMIDWAQQALRNEMMSAHQAKGISIQAADLNRIETLSNAIVRTVNGLKASSDLAQEIAKRLSPSQLLEAALAKIEAQDRATLKAAIRRLRAYLEKLGPVGFQDKQSLKELTTSGGAIASLEDE